MTGGEAQAFEQDRRYLTGLAYRMLGSVAEAEDAVQDAYLRWHGSDRNAVENPRAYLSTVVTRICLDRLKQARRHRETYVGPWLPEPLIEDPALTVAPAADVAQDVSFALMLALERLSPLERAAFLLHDVFEMGFDEIAATLERSEAACRQLASRARTHVRSARPRFEVQPDETAKVADAFFAAVRSGDTGALRELLAETATLHSDGGGRATALLNVISGAEKICRMFAGFFRKGKQQQPLWSRSVSINGMPGQLIVDSDEVLQTMALQIDDGRVSVIYVTRNPEKLRHLAPLVPREFRPV